MSDRIFAIFCDSDRYQSADSVKRLNESVAALSAAFSKIDGSEVMVFSPSASQLDGVKFDASADTEPKRRNWINRYFRNKGFTGMLHVVRGSVEITGDPSAFIQELEAAMRATDYGVWFSTVTDRCNYVYGKYSPRMRVAIDVPGLAEAAKSPDAYMFTSHSNTEWVVYDMSACTDDQLRFDERFTVPMYYIIEFLARRRNTKKPGQIYYMNQYMTVGSENGMFKSVEIEPEKQDEKRFKEENDVFAGLKLDYAMDNNADEILESLLDVLESKRGMKKEAV